MSERLGVDPRTIDWKLSREYRGHRWDGTPNPMMEILGNLAAGQWTAVFSATGVGKTFLGACILMWFLENWEDSLVVTTAPKAEQLRLHIWKEVQRLHPHFGLGELQMLRLRMRPPLDSWLAVGFVAGVSADEASNSATRAQGFHAQHMLIILEETPGIHQAVLTAFQNTSIAPHNMIVAFGNPDSQYDTLSYFAQQPRVRSVRISALDHPNVVCHNPSIVPGAQTLEGVEMLRQRYGGEDHPMYQSRARGISPLQSQTALIRWEWCQRSAASEVWREGPKALGVDVANSETGDRAAIAVGSGSRLMSVRDFQCPNANQLGSEIHQLMQVEHIAPELVGVDGIGVGAGTVNELHRLGSQIVDIQSGEQADPVWTNDVRMAEQFKNLRAQMWWQMRLDLQFREESGLVLPDDRELWVDLCTPQWGTRDGKIFIEPKEEIRRRLGRSPNKGDAAVYWNWTRYRRGGAAVTSEDLVPEARRASLADVRAAFEDSRRRIW